MSRTRLSGWRRSTVTETMNPCAVFGREDCAFDSRLHLGRDLFILSVSIFFPPNLLSPPLHTCRRDQGLWPEP